MSDPKPPPTAPAAPAGPAKPQTLVAPDGKQYAVQPQGIKLALEHGWKTPETIATDQAKDFQTDVMNRHAEKEQHRVAGGVGRFVNEATFGVGDVIDSYSQPARARAVESQAEEQFAKDHPGEVFGEKAAGFLASMAIPGVGFAGKMAEKAAAEIAAKSLAGKIGRAATKTAVEGAMYASPQAAIQAAYGDTNRAAETMLWGVGLGGVLGGAGSAAGAGVKAAAGTARELVSHKLTGLAGKSLGLTEQRMKQLGPEKMEQIINTADREGLLGLDPSKHPEAIGAMQADAASKLDEHTDKLEGLLGNKKHAGIGPKPHDVADAVQAEVADKFPELQTELHVDKHNYWKKLDDTIRGAGEEPTFKGLQKVRDAIAMDKRSPDSVKGRIAELTDSILGKHMDDAAQKLFESGGAGENFADYLAQKERHHVASELLKGPGFTDKLAEAVHGKGEEAMGLGDMGRLALGAVTGHGVLGVAHVAGHHAVKAFMSNKWGLLGKSVSFLRKAAEDPATAPLIGGLMAKEGAGALTAHLDAIPHILSGSKLAARADADIVQEIIGPTAGLTKHQQYQKLTDTITSAATDASSTADRVGDVSSLFSGTSTELAAAVAGKKLAAISYLQTQIPKNPNAPRAFQRSDEWKPSPQQQRDFLSKVEIISNPMTVWQHYAEGRLTKVDRDTLKAGFPSIYQDMVDKIAATAFDPKAPGLSREQRLQLSTFTGMPMDGSLKNLTAIQEALQSGGSQQQPQSQGPKPSSRPDLKSPSLQTDTQRITHGASSN
jgi:hypothetical protein